MKTKYNNIIEWIIKIILFIPCSILLALKNVLKLVVRLIESVQVIVECSIVYIQTICKELIKALSVTD